MKSRETASERHHVCARCAKEKGLGEFHLRAGSGRPLSYCKECQDRVKQLKMEEKLERVVGLWGGACADCGGTFPTPVFQFVHEGRAFPLSRAKHMSWEKLVQALAGHEMLCLNCGAIRGWEDS